MKKQLKNPYLNIGDLEIMEIDIFEVLKESFWIILGIIIVSILTYIRYVSKKVYYKIKTNKTIYKNDKYDGIIFTTGFNYTLQRHIINHVKPEFVGILTTEQNENNVQWTSVNSEAEQENVQLKHQLEMEKLKNVYLLQQVDHHKQLVENYQKQIDQLSKSLDKANASIQDFAQTKLLEMKGSLSGSSISQDENNSKDNQGDSEIVSSESNSKPATNQEAINTKGKKRWWSLSL